MKNFLCILVVIFALFLVGCTDPENATKTLKSQGYKQIVITGYDFFGCGKDDLYHTGFVAIGADG